MEFIRKLYQRLRRIKYHLLSDNRRIIGRPLCKQPVQFSGKGEIVFNGVVVLGYFPSPFFYNGVTYLEARRETAKIIFGDNVNVNNNLSIICEGSIVDIGDNVLIGSNVEIMDSDFHDIHPERRNSGQHLCKPVKIEDNVFIGSNVKILKGVTIGRNSVIANGSIVKSSFQSNLLISGNPASVLRVINL